MKKAKLTTAMLALLVGKAVAPMVASAESNDSWGDVPTRKNF